MKEKRNSEEETAQRDDTKNGLKRIETEYNGENKHTK